MCLRTKHISKPEISKAHGDDIKISVENTKISKETEDKKIDLIKEVNDNNGKKEKEKITEELAVVQTQEAGHSEKCNGNEAKNRKMDFNDNKNPKQNQMEQQFVNSFIAEFTQKSNASKSGKASSTYKKTESLIRDNTLEGIPRDMPKYNS
uniref:Uncharacterized protein n=1 Tax=Onchocerca volvulus TaxID=6282 RepID=A0A8R1U1B4_ONCVO